jgi:hypothetical protein
MSDERGTMNEGRRTRVSRLSPLASRHSPLASRFSPLASRLDDRGVAALEGLLIVALLAGVFLACLLLGQWGTSLQSAQMGARLLAFDAGDVELARLGKPSNQPIQQFTKENWDTLVNSVTADWLSGMYTLSNGGFSGSVTGTTRGRVPGQGSLFEYTSATMGYHANGWAAACDPWGMSESVVQSAFIRIAYHVGLTRASPGDLDSTSARPIPQGDTVVETIYGLLGQ